jgi:predicted membrane chloride channel (bestrophin family)
MEEVDRLLEHDDKATLAAALFPVQTCANKLSRTVRDLYLLDKCPVPPTLLAQLDNSIRGLLTDANACARIVTTPLPFAYIVHLR